MTQLRDLLPEVEIGQELTANGQLIEAQYCACATPSHQCVLCKSLQEKGKCILYVTTCIRKQCVRMRYGREQHMSEHSWAFVTLHSSLQAAHSNGAFVFFFAKRFWNTVKYMAAQASKLGVWKNPFARQRFHNRRHGHSGDCPGLAGEMGAGTGRCSRIERVRQPNIGR